MTGHWADNNVESVTLALCKHEDGSEALLVRNRCGIAPGGGIAQS